jgi:hypothetical protein
MSTKELIDNIKKGDAMKSNNTFNSIMQDKILDALDTYKQEVASKMYGASNDTPTERETTTDANV